MITLQTSRYGRNSIAVITCIVNVMPGEEFYIKLCIPSNTIWEITSFTYNIFDTVNSGREHLLGGR